MTRLPRVVVKAGQIAQLRARGGGGTEEVTGLGFTGLGTLKKKNSRDEQVDYVSMPSLKNNSSDGHDNVINGRC
jgi:hypothetical protein